MAFVFREPSEPTSESCFGETSCAVALMGTHCATTVHLLHTQRSILSGVCKLCSISSGPCPQATGERQAPLRALALQARVHAVRMHPALHRRSRCPCPQLPWLFWARKQTSAVSSLISEKKPKAARISHFGKKKATLQRKKRATVVCMTPSTREQQLSEQLSQQEKAVAAVVSERKTRQLMRQWNPSDHLGAALSWLTKFLLLRIVLSTNTTGDIDLGCSVRYTSSPRSSAGRVKTLGRSFDDLLTACTGANHANKARLVSIKVRVGSTGQTILSVQASYLFGALIVKAAEHGSSEMLVDGHEGDLHTLHLRSNEVLTRITGYMGQRQLNQINFLTSTGHRVGFGSPDGAKFTIKAPPNAAVFALFGGSSEFGLTALGAHFALPQNTGWFVTGADCVVSKWESCSPCTRSCGGGNRICQRQVMIHPFAGGAPCPVLVGNKPCSTRACSRDCTVSPWSRWGEPSRTCLLDGLGTQIFAVDITRTRKIVSGPSRGGARCPSLIQHRKHDLMPCPVLLCNTLWDCRACSQSCGKGTQLCYAKSEPNHAECPTTTKKKCNLKECTQGCLLSSWSSWGPCSGCINGTRNRRRSVVMLTPGCHPRLVQYKMCMIPCTALPCQVSPWSAPSACSRSCADHGGGIMIRKRTVTSRAAGGRRCPALVQYISCNQAEACPRPCHASLWGAWSRCSKSCAGGNRTRTREIVVAAVAGGVQCTLKEHGTCNSHGCPADCKVSKWLCETCSSAHNKTCGGGGAQVCRRDILRQAANGGAACPGQRSMMTQCDLSPCPRIHCTMGPWSEWSICSHTCGGGSRWRNRKVTGGGIGCARWEQLHAGENCEVHPCPVDCGYSGWGAFTSCSSTCGRGTQTRRRRVDVQPSLGGRLCYEDAMENTKECIGDCNANCRVSEWKCERCPVSCGGGQRICYREIIKEAETGGSPCPPLQDGRRCGTQACPVDCAMGLWTKWGGCDASCGTGSAHRYRYVTSQSHFGGATCGALKQSRRCTAHVCPRDCVTNKFSEWTMCTRSCAVGVQFRWRIILHPAAKGGTCGPLHQSRTCNAEGCPIDCHLNLTNCTSCTMSCGREKKQCQTTIARYGGRKCHSELTSCRLQPCPVDCALSAWGDFSSCSTSCGTGTYDRSREITTQPSHGGKECGELREQHTCKLEACKVDCVQGSWAHWSSCSKSCECGTKMRVRPVLTEPSANGKACGTVYQGHSCCVGMHCPVDCTLSAWVEWLLCSASCDGGETRRTRKVEKHAEYGGRSCVSYSLVQQRECNAHRCVVPICHQDQAACHAEVDRTDRTSHLDIRMATQLFPGVYRKTVHCGLAPDNTGTNSTSECGHLHMAAAHVVGFESPLRFVIHYLRKFNRPVYHARSRGAFLYYYQAPYHHQWIIGANVSADNGWMVANDDAQNPLAITAHWEVADARQWVQRDLAIVCVHWCGSVELQARVHMASVHSTAHQIPIQPLLGVYVLSQQSRFDRPVYKAEAANHFLYFYDGDGRSQWIVGPDPSAFDGWLYANDKSHRPENLTNGLTVNGKNSSTVSVSCAAGGCVCRCAWQPGCCPHEGFVLGRGRKLGKMLGPPFHGDSTANKCCQRCTHHPNCGAWEFSSDGTCILFPGKPMQGSPGLSTDGTYVRNRNSAVRTWAGERAPTGAAASPACLQLAADGEAYSTSNAPVGQMGVHVLRGFHRTQG
jgi:hypothetical protein